MLRYERCVEDRQGGMHVEVKQVDKGMMIRARMTIGANMQQKGMSVLGGMPVLIDSLVDIRVDDEELLGLIPQFSSVALQYTIRLSRTRNITTLDYFFTQSHAFFLSHHGNHPGLNGRTIKNTTSTSIRPNANASATISTP